MGNKDSLKMERFSGRLETPREFHVCHLTHNLFHLTTNYDVVILCLKGNRSNEDESFNSKESI